MKNATNKFAGLLLPILLITQVESSRAATLFPNRARGWTKLPTVAIAGNEGDPRVPLVREAVDFWNQQLSEIGSGFRLGPVILADETIPVTELTARSEAVLNKTGALEPTAAMAKIKGDLIVGFQTETLFLSPARS
jgi:hypothetical protein